MPINVFGHRNILMQVQELTTSERVLELPKAEITESKLSILSTFTQSYATSAELLWLSIAVVYWP